MFQVGYHTYYVYIITNKNKSVLYTGVTNYLAKRLFQHSENIRLKKKTFASRYNCSYLLYYEMSHNNSRYQPKCLLVNYTRQNDSIGLV